MIDPFLADWLNLLLRWGHLIAGHGGFIDRLDSVVFSAPIFFHLVRYGWSAV